MEKRPLDLTKEPTEDGNMKNQVECKTDWLPQKAWFSLKMSCQLKGLNYKTSCNKRWAMFRTIWARGSWLAYRTR